MCRRGILLATAAWGCATPDPLDLPAAPSGPSVLLITLDTTRADRLSVYDYALADTPVYDTLAREGVIFSRAYSTCPLTIPSHSTILTGRPPPSHGVRDNGDFILGDDAITLAERFSDAGWATAAFTSAFPTQARWGFAQGFDVYHDPLPRLPTQRDWRDERVATEVVDDALSTLSEMPSGPVFSWVHLFDAHWPYAPPPAFADAHPGRPYDGEIAYAASEVARLLDWWDKHHPRSIVVITADHGEGMGEGGEQTHGFLLHDGTIRVPLILRTRGLDGDWPVAGSVEHDPVSHVDIAPTVLRLAGLDVHPEVSGIDLEMGGTVSPWSEALTAQFSLGLSPLYALTTKDGRYTEGGWGGFYAMDGDRVMPLREAGVDTAPHAALLAQTRDSLTQDTAPEATLDADDLALLQQLGYIGGDPAAEAGTIDPRDVIDIIPLTWQVRQLIGTRRFTEAEARLARLESRMPDTWGVDHLRASLELARGNSADALQHFIDLFQRSPSSTVALHIAELYARMGLWGEAESWYRETLSLQPMSPEAMAGQVRSLRVLGAQELAWELTHRYLVLHPDHAELALARAEMLLDDGRVDDAVAEAEFALAAMPHHPWAWSVQAQTLWAQGEADRGIASLQEALRMDPLDLGNRITLTHWLLEVGRAAEAVRTVAPAARLLPDEPAVHALYAQAKGALDAELAGSPRRASDR